MGMIKITAAGSFKAENRTFSATQHGHAQAVAEAIEFLAKIVLPEAIAQDHRLQGEELYPTAGFGVGSRVK